MPSVRGSSGASFKLTLTHLLPPAELPSASSQYADDRSKKTTSSVKKISVYTILVRVAQIINININTAIVMNKKARIMNHNQSTARRIFPKTVGLTIGVHKART
jgi:hypothetical protein